MGKPHTYLHIVYSRTLTVGLVGGLLSFSTASQGRDEPIIPSPVILSPLVRMETEDGLPLRLSQMLLSPQEKGPSPRWMTLPEAPAVLRSSRELVSPPVVAGVGRPGRAAPGENSSVATAEDVLITSLSGEEGAAANLSGGLPAAVGQAASPGAQVGGWEIPPIRWGGTLGYNFQTSRSDSGSSSDSQGLFANLMAASYIYAPWFARVSGRLGFTSNSTSSQSPGVADGASDSQDSRNVVGGGEVNMFSSSRYPFRAYFDRSDSRVSGAIVTNDYTSNRFGLSQAFRTDDGAGGGSFIVDRNVVNMSNGLSDAVTAMSGSYSQQVGVLQNNVNGRYSQGERSGSGDKATLFGLNSSHIANISDTLNLGATANYSDSNIRTSTGLGSSTLNHGRYLQLYGYGSWLPEFEEIEDLPLTLSGGLRYSSQETEFGNDSFSGEKFSAQSFGGNLAALYRYSSNLSVSANAAVNKLVMSRGDGQLLTQLGSSLTYAGNPLSFGNFSYNWNAGANTNWQSAVGATAANVTSNGNAGHTLSRVYTLSSGQSLAINVSQTLNIINSQLLGSVQTLGHTASVNLGLAAGERFSGSLSTMVSDVRTSGYFEQAYRVLNVGFFGQGQLTQYSSANINLMFNWADQSYDSLDAFGIPVTRDTQSMTMNGSASYVHQRFAGVRGLRYNMIFAADTRFRDNRLYGDVNGDIDRSRYMLTNRLDYRIGLLDFRLSLVNNEVGGKKNALLFFQVSRQIGSY